LYNVRKSRLVENDLVKCVTNMRNNNNNNNNNNNYFDYPNTVL